MAESLEKKWKSACLVVAVHGLHGTESDWKYFEQSFRRNYENFKLRHVDIFRESGDDALFMLSSKQNSLFRTHDGLMTLGRRLCLEIQDFIKEKVLPVLIQTDCLNWRLNFCVISHSLGGLISRVAIRHLFCSGQESELSLESLSLSGKFSVRFAFDGHSLNNNSDEELCILVDPFSFTAVSSPLLGSRRPKLDTFSTIVSYGASLYCGNAAGKTGKELILIDAKDQIDQSLLVEISRRDGPFMMALDKFAYKTLIGHLQDFTVPASSALLCPYHKFRPKDSSHGSFSILSCEGFDYKKFITESMEKFSVDRYSVYKENVFDQRTPPSASPILRASGRRRMSHLSPEMKSVELNEADESLDDLFDENVKESDAFLAGVDVEFNAQMLRDLLSLKWRRILIDYNSDSIFRVFIHAIIIGKDFPIVPPSMRHLGRKSCDFMVKLILSDYLLHKSK